MLLKLDIIYGKETLSVDVRVGKGDQTVKWLSLIASRKYCCHGIPNTFTMLDRKVKILPKNIYTLDCSFFHPHDKINTHFQNGDKVIIELYDGGEFSDWWNIAFRHNDDGKEERTKLIKILQNGVKEFRTKIQEEEKERRLEINRPLIAKMKEIMKEQLIDKATIRETAEKEWSLIQNSGILENLVPNTSEQEKLKVFLGEHYTEFSDMYKVGQVQLISPSLPCTFTTSFIILQYYSAVNSGGGTHTLEYIEFSKFLCETDIFQSGGKNSNMILKLFLESRTTGRRDDIRGKGSIASIHSEIVQHEFFISLIKIAVYKYITLAKKENALRKKKGYHADIYSQAATPTQSHALHLLYLECLKPVIDKLPAGVTIKASLGSDEVLLIFHKNITLLSCIFCEYAECSFNVNFPNESAQSGMMNLKQFCSFATDTEFLGDSELDMQYEVSIKDVRQVFSVSQHDTVMNENEICLVKKVRKGFKYSSRTNGFARIFRSNSTTRSNQISK